MPGSGGDGGHEAAFLESRSARMAAAGSSTGSNSNGGTGFVESFWKDFRSRREEVESEIEAVREQKPAPEALAHRLDGAVAKVMALQDDAATASMELPKYDSRRAAEEISKMLERISLAREDLAPRKKFSFSARRKAAASGTTKPPLGGSTTQPQGAAAAVMRGEEVQQQEEELDERLSLVDRRGETIRLGDADLAARDTGRGLSTRDFTCKRLKDCTVTLLTVLDALRLKDLERCHIYVGPVRGSVYVDSCVSCTISVVSRQVRIHDTKDSIFYLKTASGPIIEDCNGLNFSEYCLSYEGMEAQMEDAQSQYTTNAWKDVKDFRWHKAQASPNWRILPEEERMKETRIPDEVQIAN